MHTSEVIDRSAYYSVLCIEEPEEAILEGALSQCYKIFFIYWRALHQ